MLAAACSLDACPLSDVQLAMVAGLERRVRAIAAGEVDRRSDNMFRVTTDARKISIDPRLVDPTLPIDPNGKVASVVRNVAAIWRETAAERLTQTIFCDLGVPGKARPFSVYESLRDELVAAGIPASEIAFARDARTPGERAELSRKMNCGEIRVLIGGSKTLGEGWNIQTLLVAQHSVDVPVVPHAIEQREGRIVRQGNRNETVRVFNYVATGRDGRHSLDGFLWALCWRKAKAPGRSGPVPA